MPVYDDDDKAIEGEDWLDYVKICKYHCFSFVQNINLTKWAMSLLCIEIGNSSCGDNTLLLLTLEQTDEWSASIFAISQNSLNSSYNWNVETWRWNFLFIWIFAL